MKPMDALHGLHAPPGNTRDETRQLMPCSQRGPVLSFTSLPVHTRHSWCLHQANPRPSGSTHMLCPGTLHAPPLGSGRRLYRGRRSMSRSASRSRSYSPSPSYSRSYSRSPAPRRPSPSPPRPVSHPWCQEAACIAMACRAWSLGPAQSCQPCSIHACSSCSLVLASHMGCCAGKCAQPGG